MPIQAVQLKELQLISLPSLDLRTGHGWDVVSELPESPGCYAVIAAVAAQNRPRLDVRQQREYSRALVWSLGVENARSVNNAIARGSVAAITLYIGYSKNLQRRWAGRSIHHKQQDLRAVAHLLSLFFDLRSLRLHWLLSRDADSAKYIESALIRMWKPALNDRAPITAKQKALADDD